MRASVLLEGPSDALLSFLVVNDDNSRSSSGFYGLQRI